MSLRKKTISGLLWSSLAQVGRQGIQLAITAILARLLSPHDFGLMGICFIFLGITTMLIDLGFSQAIVQKQDLHDGHLSSVFWANLVCAFFLTFLYLICAPFIASFYHKPELINMIRVMSLNIPVMASISIQQAILQKKMDFKSLMVRDIIATLVSGALAVVLALRGLGVWSLVSQNIFFAIANVFLLFSFSKWQPKFTFSYKDVAELLHFSLNAAVFGIVGYCILNIDYFLVGKFLGTQALGYYIVAFKLMMSPVQNISWVIIRVLFPAFSQIQNDLDKLRNNYLKIISTVSLVTGPLMAFLFVIAPEFVHFFYGPKWEPVVGLIRIFCVCGFLESITTFSGVIYNARGRVDIQLKLSLVNIVLLVIVLTKSLAYGIQGVANFYTCFYFLWSAVNFYVLSRFIQIRLSMIYVRLAIAIVISVGMTLILLFIKNYIPDIPFMRMSSIFVLACLIYGAFMLLFKKIKIENNSLKILF